LPKTTLDFLGFKTGIFPTFGVYIMDSAAVSAITTAVDFSTVIEGIGTIAAVVAILLISIRGGKTLLAFLGGR
jgi:hypothetical protein